MILYNGSVFLLFLSIFAAILAFLMGSWLVGLSSVFAFHLFALVCAATYVEPKNEAKNRLV
jgi:hypothetical protein